MKKAILLLAVLFSVNTYAQGLNEKGLYANVDGSFFTGIVKNEKDGLRSEFEIKDGVLHGEATFFYASGKVMEKGNFTKGEKDSKWTRFDEAGNTSAIAFYSLGKKSGTWLVFDEKGRKRMVMQYADGQKTGVWTTYDENGVAIDTKDFSKVN